MEGAFAKAASLPSGLDCRIDEVSGEHRETILTTAIANQTRIRAEDVEVIVLIKVQGLVDVSISATRIYF